METTCHLQPIWEGCRTPGRVFNLWIVEKEGERSGWGDCGSVSGSSFRGSAVRSLILLASLSMCPTSHLTLNCSNRCDYVKSEWMLVIGGQVAPCMVVHLILLWIGGNGWNYVLCKRDFRGWKPRTEMYMYGPFCFWRMGCCVCSNTFPL